jgi:hypothetical protein
MVIALRCAGLTSTGWCAVSAAIWASVAACLEAQQDCWCLCSSSARPSPRKRAQAAVTLQAGLAEAQPRRIFPRPPRTRRPRLHLLYGCHTYLQAPSAFLCLWSGTRRRLEHVARLRGSLAPYEVQIVSSPVARTLPPPAVWVDSRLTVKSRMHPQPQPRVDSRSPLARMHPRVQFMFRVDLRLPLARMHPNFNSRTNSRMHLARMHPRPV